MSWTFRELAPGVAGQLENISRLPAIRYVNETVWIFAIVETVHLIFLAVLGGSVLALNLRLLGVALTEVSIKEVERATRPWLRAGIWGTIVTGIGMGLATMTTLLGSAAFFVKIVALVSAILLSSAVARDVRADDGSATGSSQFRMLAALALWLIALFLFSTTARLGPGAFLVALAGFGLFAIVLGRHRRSYLGGLAVIFGSGLLATAAIADDWVGLATIGAALLLAGVVGTLELRSTGASVTPTRLAAFASTLAWVTVAAAGRWIGFS